MIEFALAALALGIADLATLFLGGLLLGYGLYSIRAPTFQLQTNTQQWLAPVSGGLTGIVTAFTGVASMPSVPFLQSVGLKRDELIQAMGLSFSVSVIALKTIGTRFRKRVDDTLFRKLILWTLIGLGFLLVWRSISGAI